MRRIRTGGDNFASKIRCGFWLKPCRDRNQNCEGYTTTDDDNNNNNKATQSHYNCGNDPIKRTLTRLRCAKGCAAKKCRGHGHSRKTRIAFPYRVPTCTCMKNQIGVTLIDLLSTAHINPLYVIAASREQQTTRLNATTRFIGG